MSPPTQPPHLPRSPPLPPPKVAMPLSEGSPRSGNPQLLTQGFPPKDVPSRPDHYSGPRLQRTIVGSNERTPHRSRHLMPLRASFSLGRTHTWTTGGAQPAGVPPPEAPPLITEKPSHSLKPRNPLPPETLLRLVPAPRTCRPGTPFPMSIPTSISSLLCPRAHSSLIAWGPTPSLMTQRAPSSAAPVPNAGTRKIPFRHPLGLSAPCLSMHPVAFLLICP